MGNLDLLCEFSANHQLRTCNGFQLIDMMKIQKLMNAPAANEGWAEKA